MNGPTPQTDSSAPADRRGAPAGSPAPASPNDQVSLEGLHSTVAVPPHKAGFWRQWRAFVGPAMLVSVGYMDPGNWGTDLRPGRSSSTACCGWSRLASLMAIFLQVISARLGVVTGKDLAQCCRDWYPRWTRWPNWLLCEIAIGACDLAEVLGSAVAINLLFHIPLFWAVIITGLRRVAAAGLAALRHADDRGGDRGAGGDHRRLLLHRDLRPAADAARASLEMGRALITPGFRQAGMVYRGHRHHRRDRHAAQPLPALGPGADAASCRRTRRPSAGHPLQHHRLDRGPDHRVLRQRGHPGAGGDGVLRQGQRGRCRRRRWSRSAPTATGFASPT